MEYEVIRRKRKTLSAMIKDGRVIVYAPLHTGIKEIENFLNKNKSLIEKKLTESIRQMKEAENAGILSDDDIKRLMREAKRYIPERVRYYAQIMGVECGSITIRCQKTRWGSCSSKGNLNFNCLLMLTPEDVIDSVVVHELCHLKEMNHSKRFYDLVYNAYPKYDECNKWLKENGQMIMKRGRR